MFVEGKILLVKADGRPKRCTSAALSALLSRQKDILQDNVSIVIHHNMTVEKPSLHDIEARTGVRISDISALTTCIIIAKNLQD